MSSLIRQRILRIPPPPTPPPFNMANTMKFSIFKVVADNHFAYIIHFLTIGMAPKGYTSQQEKELVVRTADFLVTVGHLYKMGVDEIL